MKISIACVCETWFDCKKGAFSKTIKDYGYEIHHAYREKKRGGGVAILYRMKMTVKEGEASTILYTSFEYVCITLTLQSKKTVMIACIYRKQEISFTIFIDEFASLAEKLIFKSDSLMFVGDFNAWVDVEEDVNAKQLNAVMNAYGLNQQVQESTHRGGHTLDQIYLNEFQIEIKHSVISEPLGITTDHLPLLLELPSSNVQPKTQTVLYRNTKKVDIAAFRKDLEQSLEVMIGNEEEESFKSMCTRFHDISLSVVDKHSPILQRKCKTTQPQWIDQEYKKSRQVRRKYERDWKKDRTEESMNKYIEQKAKCVQLALTKQTCHYSKIISEAGNCQRSLFKIANELLDKTKQKVLPPYTDAKQLANDFNKYYIDKVTKIRKTIPAIPETPSYYSRPFEGERMESFRVLSEKEVEKIMKSKGMKTSMEDPIPSRLMQPSIDILLPVFTKLVNQSLQEGSMEGIKESVLDPLLKKAGLDIEEYKNFRPVNNLLYLSKLTERCADDQVDGHMTRNCLHEGSQFAYKTHHNTEMMMLGVTDEVLRGFDDNQATVIIFLDLSAAFDTIDVEKLLTIMYEEIGLGGTVLKWFRSFLKGRTQRVKIENEYSESMEVPCGAPQGSVLGPKCFNINVRSQPLVFKKCMFTTSSFADDSNGRKQFAMTFQFNVLTNEIVECLNKIVKWSFIHFMKINPDKTEILLLCPSSLNREVIIQGVIYEEQCIRFSTEVKNVGVWLDKNLRMDKHINHITSHCYKILKDIGRISKCLDRSHLERLVHAVISSRIDYCNSLFMNLDKENMFKLQKVQNAAARLILGRRKRDSATEALKQLHWLNVDARVTFKILLLVYKILKGLCSQDFGLQYKGFNGRPDDYLILQTPVFKTAYGKRVFAYHGTRLWNALPTNVRAEDDVEKFKKSIKTLLFEGSSDLKKKAYRYGR